jgi:poly-gamma-glutamate synthesis protein (capsule biosynthesis protein)
MRGVSWRDDPACPAFSELRLLELPFVDFDGAARTGELVVNASVAEEVVAIFEELFHARFPIASMRRIEAFGGSDTASMRANNTSAFNFRFIDGTLIPSHHGLGIAVDVNPVQNPWIRGARIDPPEGAPFIDRSTERPGMILDGGVVVRAFEQHGWEWGGRWVDSLDLHHFSRLPRASR